MRSFTKILYPCAAALAPVVKFENTLWPFQSKIFHYWCRGKIQQVQVFGPQRRQRSTFTQWEPFPHICTKKGTWPEWQLNPQPESAKKIFPTFWPLTLSQWHSDFPPHTHTCRETIQMVQDQFLIESSLRPESDWDQGETGPRHAEDAWPRV